MDLQLLRLLDIILFSDKDYQFWILKGTFQILLFIISEKTWHCFTVPKNHTKLIYFPMFVSSDNCNSRGLSEAQQTSQESKGQETQIRSLVTFYEAQGNNEVKSMISCIQEKEAI